MDEIIYTLPRLSNKDNSKWLIRYTFKVNGISDYRKEVGTTYPQLKQTLNSKEMRMPKNKAKRKELADTIIELLIAELSDGVDPENSRAGYEALKLRRLGELKEYDIETNLDFYYKKVGLYSNLPDRKKDSAYNLKLFFKNQFVPYMKNLGVADDIRLITKQHIRTYLDYFYEHGDQKIKWAYSTTNTRKGWIGAFFNKLVEYDILSVNPVNTISAKKADGTGRGDYKIFSEKEVEVIFLALEKKSKLLDKRLEVFMKILYYGYIRKAEMRRIRIMHIDLKGRKFRMTSDISKKNNDGKVFTVLMNPLLQASLEEWIKLRGIDLDDPEALLFPNPTGQILARNFMVERFNSFMTQIRKDNPLLFKRKGQTIYSMKSSGVTHLFNVNKHRPDVLHFIKDQCRHQSVTTTEIYLKKLDCQFSENENFSFFNQSLTSVAL